MGGKRQVAFKRTWLGWDTRGRAQIDMIGVGHERLRSDNTVDSEGVDERLCSNGDSGGEEQAFGLELR